MTKLNTSELILNGLVKEVQRDDIARIKAGMKRAIKAVSGLHIIEVQISDELTEDDIERLNRSWK